MSRHRRGFRRLLLLTGAVALLLIAAPQGAAAAPEETDARAPEATRAEVGCGGCGCCARTAEAEAGRRCGRGGAGGCCGAWRGPAYGPGGGRGRGAPQGPGCMRGGGGSEVMRTVRALVHDHRQQIERTVEMLENGVVTVTRAPASDEAAAAIRRHVREMQRLLESGDRVRMWDPLFRELFAHADEIFIDVDELEDGMRVTETAESPRVVALIQAHARKVSQFIERGPVAVHEETPLPEGYAPAGRAAADAALQ